MPQDNSRHSILSKDGEWVPSPSAPGEYGARPPCFVIMTQANGWLVTLTAGEGYFQHSYSDEWHNARDCYDEPPRGYQAVAISACVDGVPFAKLSTFDIGQLRSDQ